VGYYFHYRGDVCATLQVRCKVILTNNFLRGGVFMGSEVQFGNGVRKRMAILKAAGIATLAAFFCVGCGGGGGDKSSGGDVDGGGKSKNVNSLEMVKVKGGTFTGGEIGTVTVGDFSIGKYEVTRKLWGEIMDQNVSDEDKNLPVANVSYNEVETFLQMLNKKTGQNYRLPTEEEWEYAARGGNKSKGYEYSGGNEIIHVAWYNENSGGRSHNVGTREPNELGIYDMSGNVWEWTSSLYSNDGSDDGSDCVVRGGSWGLNARRCRVSNRANGNSYAAFGYIALGFRLGLSP
jgi:formylglycine-generating enzyme required for sulfatase activity